MDTTASSTVVPPEVSEKIDLLSSQVATLQKELSQALDIWRSTLAEEKENFENLMSHKDLANREQDAQWERQAQAFEGRLAEIKSEFEARLAQTEQNAARSLTELDDAWQRDKLEWGPAAQSQWPAERRQLEDKIQSLEEELAQLRREHVVQASSGPTPETVKALQNQLLEFQQTVAALQDRAARSDELVSACVQAMDYQISVLYDLVQQAVTSAAGPDASLAQS
jgi:chromosome segregation ATPase